MCHVIQVDILDAFSVFDPNCYVVNCASSPYANTLNAAAKGREKLTVLANHYSTGEDAPVNCEAMEEWKSLCSLNTTKMP